jgi:hypothetical protein
MGSSPMFSATCLSTTLVKIKIIWACNMKSNKENAYHICYLLTESDAAPVTDLILLRGKGLRFLSILKYLLLRLAGSVAMWRRPVVIFRSND